jgi:hypothetical protein
MREAINDPSVAAGVVFFLGLAIAAIVYARFFIRPARNAGLPDWQIAFLMRYSPLLVIVAVVIMVVLIGAVVLLHSLLNPQP